jgi:ssDNA-specific exonuclease RecJ
MTIELPQQTRAYNDNGVIWLIKGERLYQIDNETMLRYGESALYNYMMQRLKTMKEMEYSKVQEIKTNLLKNINELID